MIVAYAGVFETDVSSGQTRVSEEKCVDFDSSLDTSTDIGDTLLEAFFLNGDDFGVWQDGHAALLGELFAHHVRNIAVVVGHDACSGVGDVDFGAKDGHQAGDFDSCLT